MSKNSAKKSGIGSGFDSFTGRIRRFISDTIAELGRCTWPTRQELLESTGLVVVAIAILAVFVWGVDEVAMRVIDLVTVGRR